MTLTMECDECSMQGSRQCRDCVVTFLCDGIGGAMIIDADEERAIRMLARAGLVPARRSRTQASCA